MIALVFKKMTLTKIGVSKMNFKSYNAILALSLVAVLAACGEGKKEEKSPEAPAAVTESAENKTEVEAPAEKASEPTEAEATKNADVPEDATDEPTGETKTEDAESK
jgi:uncharacterized lipoprotein